MNTVVFSASCHVPGFVIHLHSVLTASISIPWWSSVLIVDPRASHNLQHGSGGSHSFADSRHLRGRRWKRDASRVGHDSSCLTEKLIKHTALRSGSGIEYDCM